MPQTTSKRDGSTITHLTVSEVSVLRVALSALQYLAEREKCAASKDAVINLTAVLAKWEKPKKAAKAP